MINEGKVCEVSWGRVRFVTWPLLSLAGVPEFVFCESVEFLFREVTFADEISEDEGQDGVAVVVGAVDLVAALGEPAFQFPEIGGLSDGSGAPLGFLNDGIQFPLEGCSFQTPAGMVAILVTAAS
jgi:hypothetical protein